nr:hypothetical protein [Tanacetum cinerariifolium]
MSSHKRCQVFIQHATLKMEIRSQEEKKIKEEQAAKTRYWKIPICYDNDDDDDEDYTIAITPILSTEEPDNSLRCDLLREKFKEDLFTSCVENGILQDSSGPSNDNSNDANALREPFVVNLDPGKNSSQSPPQISNHCCCGCGNPLEGIFYHQCTCKLCGNGVQYGYNCLPKVPIIPDPEPFNNHTIKELPPTVQSFDSKSDLVYNSPNNIVMRLRLMSLREISIVSIEINKKEKLLQLEQLANLSTYPSKRFNSFCYDDDDEDYTIAVTPSLSTEEPDNSLIPSESEGIPDNMCDVPFHDNSPPLDVSKDQFEDFSDSNDAFSSTDDDSFSIDNIEYVEASPPNSELVSLEVMEIVIPEVGGIDDDILLTFKDDILREKLLNINLLIAKIKALNDNPPPSSDFMTKSSSTFLNSLLEETNTFDNPLPEFEISALIWKRLAVVIRLFSPL